MQKLIAVSVLCLTVMFLAGIGVYLKMDRLRYRMEVLLGAVRNDFAVWLNTAEALFSAGTPERIQFEELKRTFDATPVKDRDAMVRCMNALHGAVKEAVACHSEDTDFSKPAHRLTELYFEFAAERDEYNKCAVKYTRLAEGKASAPVAWLFRMKGTERLVEFSVL